MSGTAFPLPYDLGSGTVTIEDWENWLYGDAAGGVGSYDHVHPGMTSVLMTRGTAMPIADVLELLGCRLEDGPMVANQRTEVTEPLRVGVHYVISAQLTAIERKEGRRAGTFDLVTYVVTLAHEERPVSVIKTMFIVPRKSS